MIFSEHLFTGDGLVTALSVVRAMVESGRELHELAGELVTYPQVLVNVRVRERTPLGDVPAVRRSMTRVEDAAERQGRLLVRYSGTEPLLRIMIEGRDQDGDSGAGRTRSPTSSAPSWLTSENTRSRVQPAARRAA